MHQTASEINSKLHSILSKDQERSESETQDNLICSQNAILETSVFRDETHAADSNLIK